VWNSTYREGGHQQLISNGERIKPAFAERDKKKTRVAVPRCGSGSADPCLGLMDPDPAMFIIDLQDGNKKLI
jgi:hypothetical protein